ncbi:MAG: hypothetical protein IRY99_17890 [Isosphaeraceae bacterium]|nr:hypothetical protein [Isosphaeraceae bacterium]
MSTESDNDRQVALAIAQAQAEAQVEASHAAADANKYGSDKQLEGVKYETDHRKEAAAEPARISADAQKYAADKGYAGTQYGADKDADSRKYVADKSAEASKYGSDKQAEASKYGSDKSAEASKYGSDKDIEGIKYAADKQADASKYGSDKDLDGRKYSADKQKDATTYGADKDLDGRKYAADKQSDAQRYDADKQLEGVKYSQDKESARLERKLGYADGKFNIVFPFVQSSLDQALGTVGQGSVSTPGLLGFDEAPYIAARGVFTPADIQRQINLAYARNDARTESQIRQAQGDLAGRGFSSNSPIMDALRVGFVGQNMRASNEAATQIRLASAQANVDSMFRGQQAKSEQFNQIQQVALDSERNQVTRQVGLLGAVAQMVGGLT